MHPDFRTFKSPFELGLTGVCIAAVVVVAALIGLYLTDAGVINW